jgi:hypothetical protein
MLHSTHPPESCSSLPITPKSSTDTPHLAPTPYQPHQALEEYKKTFADAYASGLNLPLGSVQINAVVCNGSAIHMEDKKTPTATPAPAAPLPAAAPNAAPNAPVAVPESGAAPQEGAATGQEQADPSDPGYALADPAGQAIDGSEAAAEPAEPEFDPSQLSPEDRAIYEEAVAADAAARAAEAEAAAEDAAANGGGEEATSGGAVGAGAGAGEEAAPYMEAGSYTDDQEGSSATFDDPMVAASPEDEAAMQAAMAAAANDPLAPEFDESGAYGGDAAAAEPYDPAAAEADVAAAAAAEPAAPLPGAEGPEMPPVIGPQLPPGYAPERGTTRMTSLLSRFWGGRRLAGFPKGGKADKAAADAKELPAVLKVNGIVFEKQAEKARPAGAGDQLGRAPPVSVTTDFTIRLPQGESLLAPLTDPPLSIIALRLACEAFSSLALNCSRSLDCIDTLLTSQTLPTPTPPRPPTPSRSHHHPRGARARLPGSPEGDHHPADRAPEGPFQLQDRRRGRAPPRRDGARRRRPAVVHDGHVVRRRLFGHPEARPQHARAGAPRRPRPRRPGDARASRRAPPARRGGRRQLAARGPQGRKVARRQSMRGQPGRAHARRRRLWAAVGLGERGDVRVQERGPCAVPHRQCRPRVSDG